MTIHACIVHTNAISIYCSSFMQLVSVLVKIFDIKHAKTTPSDMHLVVMIHIDILHQWQRNHIHNTWLYVCHTLQVNWSSFATIMHVFDCKLTTDLDGVLDIVYSLTVCAFYTCQYIKHTVVCRPELIAVVTDIVRPLWTELLTRQTSTIISNLQNVSYSIIVLSNMHGLYWNYIWYNTKCIQVLSCHHIDTGLCIGCEIDHLVRDCDDANGPLWTCITWPIAVISQPYLNWLCI